MSKVDELVRLYEKAKNLRAENIERLNQIKYLENFGDKNNEIPFLKQENAFNINLRSRINDQINEMKNQSDVREEINVRIRTIENKIEQLYSENETKNKEINIRISQLESEKRSEDNSYCLRENKKKMEKNLKWKRILSLLILLSIACSIAFFKMVDHPTIFAALMITTFLVLIFIRHGVNLRYKDYKTKYYGTKERYKRENNHIDNQIYKLREESSDNFMDELNRLIKERDMYNALINCSHILI